MKLERKQYPAIDVAKLICAVLVLFYHYFSEYGSLPGLLQEALSLYAVAVALFMTMSGFLFFEKLTALDDRKKRWEATKKQIFRILRVYLLWSIPYLIFTVTRWNFETLTVHFLLSQIQRWLFHSTFHTIWFMPSIALGIFLAHLVNEYLPRRVACTLAIILYILGASMSTYSFVGMRSDVFKSIAAFSDTWLGGSRGGFFYGFPLVYFGGMISHGKKHMHAVTAGIISVILMGFLLGEALVLRRLAHAHTGIDLCMFMPVVCIAIIYFLIGLSFRNGKILLWMRRMSVLIFMSQRLFLTVLPELTSGLSVWQSKPLSFLLICGGTVCFSAIILYLSKRILWLRRLY